MRQVSIHSVISLYETYLLQLPNVSHVGTGKRNGREIIQIFVYNAQPFTHRLECEMIPQMLDGFETEVVVLQNTPHSALEV